VVWAWAAPATAEVASNASSSFFMVHSLVFFGLAIRRESQYGQDSTVFP
jgi:hypothetical protein